MVVAEQQEKALDVQLSCKGTFASLRVAGPAINGTVCCTLDKGAMYQLLHNLTKGALRDARDAVQRVFKTTGVKAEFITDGLAAAIAEKLRTGQLDLDVLASYNEPDPDTPKRVAHMSKTKLEEAFFQALIDTNITLRKWEQQLDSLHANERRVKQRDFSTELVGLFNNHFKKCLVHEYSKSGAEVPYGSINRLLRCVKAVVLGTEHQVSQVLVSVYSEDCVPFETLALCTGYAYHWQDKLPAHPVVPAAADKVIRWKKAPAPEAEKAPTMDDVFAGMASFKF